MQRDPERVLVYYSKSQYIGQEFIQAKPGNEESVKYTKTVIDALEFLNHEFKKCQSI